MKKKKKVAGIGRTLAYKKEKENQLNNAKRFRAVTP